MSKKKNSRTPEKRKPLTSSSIQSIEQRYSGPIPPASDFERYNHTLPGAANRILQMSENQQVYDHKINLREQNWYYASRFFAQFIVFFVAMSTIAAGTYLIKEGYSTSGIAILLGALATFGGTIIFGKKQDN
ncbi:MAG: DUF2335 domain-containing protein [Balneolales bacterium]